MDRLVVSKDPVFLGRGPVADVFVPKRWRRWRKSQKWKGAVDLPEPQLDLMLSRFNSVTSVADVTPNLKVMAMKGDMHRKAAIVHLNTVVSPDGPRLACCRIGLAQHHPDSPVNKQHSFRLAPTCQSWQHPGLPKPLLPLVQSSCKTPLRKSLQVSPYSLHQFPSYKSWEEWPGCQIGVVLPKMSLSRPHHPEKSDRFQNILLKKG